MRDGIPDFYPRLIDAFIPLDKSGPQRFTDYGWSGLPMDNQASDALLPTEFTEAWVPLTRTREVMELLRTYFSDPDDAHEASTAAPARTRGSCTRRCRRRSG